MPVSTKRRVLQLSALLLLLLCCLAPACTQTEEANKLVDEMNALTTKGEEIARQAAAKFQEMQEMSFEKERDEVKKLARDSSVLFGQAADNFKQAAGKAEEAGRLKIDDWYKNYLTLKAQQIRKRGEVFDLFRQEGEIASTDGPLEDINAKIEEFEARVDALNKEGEELTRQVKKIEEERKEDFRKEEEGAKQ